MIAFDDALSLTIQQAQPLGAEMITLDEAGGRVLAAHVVARIDAPRSDVSAMDGFAVRECDLNAGKPLRLIGTSWPGAGYKGSISAGECVRIFTGATVPAGADRVVIQEDTEREDEYIRIREGLGPGRHVRHRGTDFRTGDRLLESGRLLDHRTLVAAAGADLGHVQVWRKPRIAILGTGDELTAPGRAGGTQERIPESVSLGVAALAEQWGAEIVGRQTLKDEPDGLADAARHALASSDLVVISGGASVGEKDFAKAVFISLGFDILFSKVAIKPGKPVWFGQSQKKLVLGLPGNPTSALVTARLLLAPLIAGLGGRDPMSALFWRTLPLADALPPCGDRETFLRGRSITECVQPIFQQDSGAQLALADADVLIRRSAGAPAAQVGDLVDVIAF